ncbi:MAG: hypothetical protein U5L96_13775 [Owenweeksia sp.]|nr:hypothetical protein [Owenweeksia sp.]
MYGVDVQVYQNGELAKHFIVGTETQDEMGTYMMMKNAQAPYAVHIPALTVFYLPVFSPNPTFGASALLPV